MASNRNYTERRWNRYVKGMRRVKEDRAEHGGWGRSPFHCPCFGDDVTRGRGQIFDRFADHPKTCSEICCGNLRKWCGESRQERKAATVKDWE